MTTMTMPAAAVRATPVHAEDVSHLRPLLVALALLAASAIVSVLLSGAIH